jgi:hypothetical protein
LDRDVQCWAGIGNGGGVEIGGGGGEAEAEMGYYARSMDVIILGR